MVPHAGMLVIVVRCNLACQALEGLCYLQKQQEAMKIYCTAVSRDPVVEGPVIRS